MPRAAIGREPSATPACQACASGTPLGWRQQAPHSAGHQAPPTGHCLAGRCCAAAPGVQAEGQPRPAAALWCTMVSKLHCSCQPSSQLPAGQRGEGSSPAGPQLARRAAAELSAPRHPCAALQSAPRCAHTQLPGRWHPGVRTGSCQAGGTQVHAQAAASRQERQLGAGGAEGEVVNGGVQVPLQGQKVHGSLHRHGVRLKGGSHLQE
jgi:hypothetical protein